MDIQQPPASNPHKLHSESLESTFSVSLHIQETVNSEKYSVGDCNIDDGVNINAKQFNLNVKKCTTFPYTGMLLPPSSSDEEEEASTPTEANTPIAEPLSEIYPHQLCSLSICHPTPDRPASAIKGSRQKRGIEPLKLTVKWAPDVYDPEPNSLSHTIKGKKQHRSKSSRKGKSEKKGKKGQKSSSNRGGSDKEKKQYSKYGGSSLMCYAKKLDDRDKLVSVH